MHSSSRGPCHRCGRSGHLARDCSLHTCFRCNGRGHMAWECAERVTCIRCGEKGHLQRNCKNVLCHRCGKKGHISKFCNDLFAKAAAVERLEKERMSLQSKMASGHVFTHELKFAGSSSSTSDGIPVKLRTARSPWDGLGCQDHKRDSAGQVIFGQKKVNRDFGVLPADSQPMKKMMLSLKVVKPQRNGIHATKQDFSKLKSNLSRNNSNVGSREGNIHADWESETKSNGQSWHGLVCYESEE